MTPQAASETVTNSVTWYDVDLKDGVYYGIWEAGWFAIPFEDGEDMIFAVESENYGEITTAKAQVYGKMARINRNTTEQDKKVNYNGSIVNGKLTLVNKEKVQ